MKKKIFLSLALAATLTTASFAAAGEVSGMFSDIKLFLNGNKVEKQILVVDGSSYLPVRAISEALDLEVGWNGDTRAISLTSKQNQEDADAAVAKEFGVLEKVEEENKELKAEVEKLRAELGQYKPQLEQEGELVKLEVQDYGKIELTGGKMRKVWWSPRVGTPHVKYHLNSGGWNEDRTFTVDEKSYDTGYGINLQRNKEAYLNLENKNLKYTKFSGYFAVDSLMSKNLEDKEFIARIYKKGDSTKELYKENINVEDGLVKFEVDITGMEGITVKMSRKGDIGDQKGDENYFLLLNPTAK